MKINLKTTSQEFKIFIAGVGSLYRHDDGIGIEIINILQQQNNPGLILCDAGTDGFSLFDKLQQHSRSIIIDAVAMDQEPGTVKLFSPSEAKLLIRKDALSTHGFGLAEVLNLAEELEVKTEIKIIGIQPKDISLGEGLSEEIKNQIPKILDLIDSGLTLFSGSDPAS